jgi:hypothetical protein
MPAARLRRARQPDGAPISCEIVSTISSNFDW